MASESSSNTSTDESVERADGPVILASALGIQNIYELTAQLAAALDAEGPITLDASNVDSLDTAAIQVLVAFANSVLAESRALQWLNPSHVTREHTELLDLDRFLGIDIDPAPAVEEDDGLCPVF